MKVIHLFPTPNVYSLMTAEYQPDISFVRSDKPVGIFRGHWCNLMCDALMGVTNEFDLEIWQPDHHTDRIYEHTFENNVKHILFPFGTKLDNPEHKYNNADLSSFIQRLKSFSPDEVIVQLHEFANPITQTYLNSDISAGYINVLLQHGGDSFYHMAGRGRNILRRFGYFMNHLNAKKISGKIAHSFVQSGKAERELRTFYSGSASKITMGIDCKYWCAGDKLQIRKKLGLADDTPVILSASMLRPKKRIKELLEVFVTINTESNKNFKLVVAGGGDPDYIKELKAVASELIEKNKVVFTGRLSDEELLEYYQAADLFMLLTSGNEGSPVAIIKAHSCGLPVLTTDFGESPEILRTYNVGKVLMNNFREWVGSVQSFLDGTTQYKVLDKAIVEAHYSWDSISKKYAENYRELFAAKNKFSK